MEIDIREPEPFYLQLAAWLRNGIRDGRWGPDEAIPSIKWIGEHVSTPLTIGTIRRAIKVLVDEELVYTRPGHGTYVSRDAAAKLARGDISGPPGA